MNHWLLVFRDIWSILRWILPPFLFWMWGSVGAKVYDDVPVLLLILPLAVFLYFAAVSGWWI